eukprot:6223267-Amphidinium_carterae.1
MEEDRAESRKVLLHGYMQGLRQMLWHSDAFMSTQLEQELEEERRMWPMSCFACHDSLPSYVIDQSEGRSCINSCSSKPRRTALLQAKVVELQSMTPSSTRRAHAVALLLRSVIVMVSCRPSTPRHATPRRVSPVHSSLEVHGQSG